MFLRYDTHWYMPAKLEKLVPGIVGCVNDNQPYLLRAFPVSWCHEEDGKMICFILGAKFALPIIF